METFAVTAKNEEKAQEVKDTARPFGFDHVPDSPDFVVSVGGDGTFLISERRRPGVPKLLVRDSLVCYKCHDEPLEEMLQIIRDDRWRIVEMMKLRGRAQDWSPLAVNEVVVRNVDPRHALRFRLSIDGERIGETLIGDGIIVATPFGSTGYYRSVTQETFSEGIGVAFNNLTERRDPLSLGEDAVVALEIVRGTAHLSADNHPDVAEVREGTRVGVGREPDEKARLVGHQ
jgi:NAD+ kinase